MSMIKVMIADDHSMVREGIMNLLELDDNISVVGFAGDGFECLRKVSELKPDVLLLDINMPNMNGIETLRELKNKKSNVKVIMLTIHNEGEYILKAVEIGCEGYVLKDSDSNMLKKAIYTVYLGESFLQPDLVPILNQRLMQKEEEDEQLDKLTRREIEVLILLAEGLFNKEIAYKLNISERTVKNHISNIFKKIDVSDRTQAAVFAIKNKLVNL
ncbi:MAG: response regulator transcription factor [Lachnospiraceae bacterium]|nr:response regulator transcription factor [Lachnospiraceae bacterium]